MTKPLYTAWLPALALLLLACSGPARVSPEAAPEAALEGLCPADADLEAFLADWLARRPARALATESMAGARCAQTRLVNRLAATLGPPVGYKVALTSEAVQQRFKVSEPVRGVLLAGMLLDDGAIVEAGYGARPVYEADLLVVVADESINTATTPAEVLANLSVVIPFIELADLALAKGEPLDARTITAMNAGARRGVLGAPLEADRSEAFLRALAEMSVTVTDGSGAEKARAKGSAILGHPLNSVLWLLRDGARLKVGDKISLGSIGPLLPVEAGLAVTVTYAGLPGDPGVSVRFK
jgi:2-keto-4-pentenoate hydratase